MRIKGTLNRQFFPDRESIRERRTERYTIRRGIRRGKVKSGNHLHGT